MSVVKFERKTPEDPPSGDYSCLFCGKPTAYEALSNYGARCFSCFESYCNQYSHNQEPSKPAQRIHKEIAQWAQDMKGQS